MPCKIKSWIIEIWTEITISSTAKAKGEVKLYFQDPVELSSIFADLEDENLALIQECREAESDLERIRTIVREVVPYFTIWISIKYSLKSYQKLRLKNLPIIQILLFIDAVKCKLSIISIFHHFFHLPSVLFRDWISNYTK